MSRHAMEITSVQNKVFKRFKALTMKKNREKEGLFILEGQRYIDTAISSGHPFEAIFIARDAWTGFSHQSRAHIYLEACPVYIISETMMNELAQTEQTQGIVGIAKVKGADDALGSMTKNILVLDRLQDPGNLGTIIRTADAAGFGTIFLTKGTVDPYNSKVVRSTAGSILNVDLIEIDDKVETLLHLKSKGYRIVVTALENALDYNDMNGYGKQNCIVIGNEANGVSDEIMALADVRIKIPIVGKAESLNAAVAAALMMYKTNEFAGKSS